MATHDWFDIKNISVKNQEDRSEYIICGNRARSKLEIRINGLTRKFYTSVYYDHYGLFSSHAFLGCLIISQPIYNKQIKVKEEAPFTN